MRMANKAGLITAAASGMGRAGALTFAREGASVAIVDRDQSGAEAVAREINEAGGRAIAIAGDLRDDGFARDIVHRTVAAFGGLDFAWNHVGHPGPSMVEGIEMSEYELAMDLNVRTVFVTTTHAIPAMRGARRRRAAVHRQHLGHHRLDLQPDLLGRQVRRHRHGEVARQALWP